jgi:hypothetical protein
MENDNMIDKISDMLDMNRSRKYAMITVDAHGKKKVVHLTEKEMNELNGTESAWDNLIKKVSEVWNSLLGNKRR